MRTRKSPLDSLKSDSNGKVIPDDESTAWVLREHANTSDDEKYRLAQAHTILKAWRVDKKGRRSNSK
jgi:hypothetical protein